MKPGFFKNEQLAAVAPFARLLFAGLWCLADREGRLEDRPLRIKAEVFPFDGVDAEALLVDLQRGGLIVRYVVDEARYISIPNFVKHQNPHPHEPKSLLPNPIEGVVTCNDMSAYSLNPSSLNPSNLKPPNPLPGESAKPTITESEFLDTWNTVPTFVHAKGLTAKRLRHFQARTRDRLWLENWRVALRKASEIPFCRGDNDSGWRATIDWFLRPDTVLRIVEGAYDFGSSKPSYNAGEHIAKVNANVDRQKKKEAAEKPKVAEAAAKYERVSELSDRRLRGEVVGQIGLMPKDG